MRLEPTAVLVVDGFQLPRPARNEAVEAGTPLYGGVLEFIAARLYLRVLPQTFTLSHVFIADITVFRHSRHNVIADTMSYTSSGRS